MPNDLPPYSTIDVSRRSGYTVGTLVYYACQQRHKPEDRRQDPPVGMPRPKRAHGKLLWPAAATDRWIAKHPKPIRVRQARTLA